MKGTHFERTIIFPDINDSVKIVARAWGISGNHEAISISPASSGVLDSSKIQVFYYSEIYYKRSSPDSLTVYAGKWALKPKPLTEIGRVKLGLVYYKDSKKMEQGYTKLGLERISVYPERK